MKPLSWIVKWLQRGQGSGVSFRLLSSEMSAAFSPSLFPASSVHANVLLSCHIPALPATISYLNITFVNPLFLADWERKASRLWKSKLKFGDGIFQSAAFSFDGVCNKLMSPIFPAIFQRPSLAVRGEVTSMTPSSQDPSPASMACHLPFLSLLLLLFPCVFAQPAAVPAMPNLSSVDLLTHPECTKKEHPKVSIQGQRLHSDSLVFMDTRR